MTRCAPLAALLLLSCAREGSAPAISIEDAWARATAPGQGSAAVYFTIRNGGGQDRLTGVSTTAGRASLHSTSMADGIARMRPVATVDIPAGAAVALRSGGTHVMIADLSGPLQAGSKIPLDLSFERSGRRRVDVPVRAADGGER